MREMARKRGAAKAKGIESSPPKEEWSKSKCNNSIVLRLVGECLPQVKEVVQWRAPPKSDDVPYDNVDDLFFFYNSLDTALPFLLPISFKAFLISMGFRFTI